MCCKSPGSPKHRHKARNRTKKRYICENQDGWDQWICHHDCSAPTASSEPPITACQASSHESPVASGIESRRNFLFAHIQPTDRGRWQRDEEVQLTQHRRRERGASSCWSYSLLIWGPEEKSMSGEGPRWKKQTDDVRLDFVQLPLASRYVVLNFYFPLIRIFVLKQ